MMSEANLSARMKALEERLQQVEAYLGLPAVAPRAADRPAPFVELPPDAPSEPVVEDEVAPLPPVEEPIRTGSSGPSWEVIVGERWMAWVGSIVVVIAVGFFVKLAYDMGWIGRLPPAGRCAMGALFGTLLLIGGEWALRRVGRHAAVGLYGAGLGTLYLTAFATCEFYNLVSQTTAFWLMVCVATLGVLITVRGKLLTIGVLSLIGGYLSPILLPAEVASPAALPLYLSGLMVVGLTLSARYPVQFRPLRYVVLGLHLLVATMWLVLDAGDHWLIAISFLTAWWGLITAEALYAALRDQSLRGNCIASLLFTFWYACAGCGVLAAAEPFSHDWLGIFAGGVAAMSAWLALTVGPGYEVLRRRPKAAVDVFVATLWGQVGILVASAIALHFRNGESSFGQTLGWLVMACVCIEMGRRLPSFGTTVLGMLVGALALVRVWAVDWKLTALQHVVFSVGSVSIDYWALVVLAAIAILHLAAWRLKWRNGRATVGIAILLSFLSVVHWLALCNACCNGMAVTAGWLLAALALLGATHFTPRMAYRKTAAFVLVLTAARWLISDALLGRFSPAWDATVSWPLWNWQLAYAVGIAAAIYWLHRCTVGATPPRNEAASLSIPGRAQAWFLAACALVLVALGFEVDRVLAAIDARRVVSALWHPTHARLLWWTLLAAAGGITIWFWGRRQRMEFVRSAGTFLLGAAAMAWLTLDTVTWRMSFGVTAAQVVLNTQFLVGLATCALLVLFALIARRDDRADSSVREIAAREWRYATAAVIAFGLWLGSMEIDRYCALNAGTWSNAEMAGQTALSVYWSLYAIALLALGFWRQNAPLRYAGLGLLAIAMGKVLIVDLAGVRYIYRVLSLLVVGLLFIATSITYARLAPRMDARGESVVPGSSARDRRDIGEAT